jgi:ribosomal protein L5
MNISIVTTAKTNEHAFVLLEMMGLPFRAPKKPKAGA